MKRKALIYFFLLSTCMTAQVIRFEKVFGGINNEQGWAGQLTSDKGFILTGTTSSTGAGGTNCYLIKTDSSGTLQWTNSYGGTHDDEAFAVKQTNDGGYILCGYTKSFGAGGYDVFLVKTNALGDTLWTRAYGTALNDYGNSIQLTSDGGYIVAGYTNGMLAAGDSGCAYLLRINPDGSMKWSKSFGSPSMITDAYALSETSDKGFIITGYTNGGGEPNGDAFLTKTDSSGNIQFMKTYGGKGTDWGNSVKQTSDGGFVIGGSISTDSTSKSESLYLIKTNSLGDTLFTKTFGGGVYSFGQSILQMPDLGYALAGYTDAFGSGNSDACLIRTNASGDTLFTGVYGGSGDDEANAVFQASDGTLCMAGFSNSYGSGFYDLFLIKTDLNGKSGCVDHNFTYSAQKIVTQVSTITPSYGSGTTIVSGTHPVSVPVGVGVDVCTPAWMIREPLQSIALSVFPNPCQGTLSLDFHQQLSKEATVVFTDIHGKALAEYKLPPLHEQYDLTLDELPNGFYFYQIRLGSEIPCRGKITLIK